MTDKLFINKYQPLFFNDFGNDNDVIEMLKTLIFVDDLNIILIGDMT